MAFIVKRDAPGFGLPANITIAGAVGDSVSVNGTYRKTNQSLGYLAESTNGSFNYHRATYPEWYITSPENTNSNGDYNYGGWVIALSADGAYFSMTNPSTDKSNFPTTGWVYSRVYGDGTVNPSNSAGQSGPASLTITAFPNVYIDGALYLKYDDPSFPASIYFSAGNANIYYINISNPGEEYPQHTWLVFSAIAGDAGGNVGGPINLQANKWYILSGGCGDGGCSIYIVSVNTSANQTSANIPLQNWSNGATIITTF
jgi:hypothetical protein